MRMRVPGDLTLPEERSNYHHLVQDIAWYGLALAATSRFMSVYAIRLGATPIELGLISSLPAIVLLFSSALGGWWLRRYGSPVRAMLLPGIGFRMLFLLPAFAPFFPLEWQPLWLILSVTLPAIPQGISGVAFMVVMRKAIHDNHMTSLISQRMMALNVGLSIAALAFGVWLEKAPFPLNYQLMFLVAFGFALMSERHCLKLRCIVPTPQPQETNRSDNPWKATKFLRVAFVVMVSHIAFTSIVPITPLHLMENLGATEGFVALFGMAELIAGALITLWTPRIVARIGNQAMIALALIGTALAAVLIALAPSQPLTLIAGALSGASWTAAGVGVYGFFTQSTPPESMTRWSTAYQQMIGLAMFIGPMIGSTLVNSGMRVVLVILIGAGLRLLAGALTEYGVFMKIGQVRQRARIFAMKPLK